MEEVIILTGKPFSAPQCHRRCQPSQRCVQDHHYHYILISFKNKVALINRWVIIIICSSTIDAFFLIIVTWSCIITMNSLKSTFPLWSTST